MAKELNWFYLIYTGSFASHGKAEISVTVCIQRLCPQISVAAAAIINSVDLGFFWKTSSGILQMIRGRAGVLIENRNKTQIWLKSSNQ